MKSFVNYLNDVEWEMMTSDQVIIIGGDYDNSYYLLRNGTKHYLEMRKDKEGNLIMNVRQ